MNRLLKGSYTIEMAMLFPFIMTSIIIVIYMSFFIHDRTVINSAAYQSAMHAAMITKGGVDVQALAKDRCMELLDNRLIITKGIKIEAHKSLSDITVKCSGDFEIPAEVIWIKELKEGKIKISAAKSASTLNPTQFVRNIRVTVH